MYRKASELIGKKFGLLTVLEKVPKPEGRSKYSPAYVRATCDCGRELIAEARRIRYGHTTSCGCKRRSPEESAFQKVWNNYIHSAKSRSLELSLGKEDVRRITSRPCYYCGIHDSCGMKTSTGRYTHKYNGIDRIDNSKGYTLDNSRPCCYNCNRAKGEMTEKAFFNWIKSIYEVYLGSQ